MVVNGSMLASELRRRRVRPRSLANSVQGVRRSTQLLGDLRTAPTSLLVLAAMNLADRPGAPTTLPGDPLLR